MVSKMKSDFYSKSPNYNSYNKQRLQTPSIDTDSKVFPFTYSTQQGSSCLWFNYIYIIVEKISNSSHLYDRGFMDVIPIVRQSKLTLFTNKWYVPYFMEAAIFLLTTLCGNVDKHSPVYIYIYIYI